MTSRALLVLFAMLLATGCPPDAPKYAVKVDNPVVKFKPADPDDLIEEEDVEDEDEDEGAAQATEE